MLQAQVVAGSSTAAKVQCRLTPAASLHRAQRSPCSSRPSRRCTSPRTSQIVASQPMLVPRLALMFAPPRSCGYQYSILLALDSVHHNEPCTSGVNCNFALLGGMHDRVSVTREISAMVGGILSPSAWHTSMPQQDASSGWGKLADKYLMAPHSGHT